jgi:phosphatidylserine/phosphatidylglycerophosphate/cardiolipin synthase-like enzyme
MPVLLECPSLEENLILCSELGLDFIELNMNLPEYQLDRINPARIKRLLQQYRKYLTIHLGENLNVCDFNTTVARLHQKFAIIDERIVWYGSINLLSFNSSEESSMRLESADIACELMRVMENI